MFVSVAFDQRLVTKLHQRSGLAAHSCVIVVSGDRIAVRPGWLKGRVDARAGGKTTSVEIAGERYLVLLAPGEE